MEQGDLIEEDFDIEAIQNDKYTSTEINSFKLEIRTKFHDHGLLPEKKIYKQHIRLL